MKFKTCLKINQLEIPAFPRPVFSHCNCPAGRAMDEESLREKVLLRALDLLPQRKAGSKGCGEISAETRLC
jgi:hypothetical protein